MSNNGNNNGGKPNPLNQPRAGRFEASSVQIEGDKPLSLDEIKNLNEGGGLDMEQVTGVNASDDAVELEAFMNEIVFITIPESTDEEDLPVVSIGVNGMQQPIVRGVSTPVKRKYVEVLAHAKETKYKQVLADSSDPASVQMVPRTALSYPFSVDRDDNPNGRAWLRDLLKQPA